MKIYSMLFCVVLLMVCHNVSAQKNLVSNGSFEDELNDWNGGSNAKATPWDFKAGKNSCAITVYNVTSWVGVDQIIRVPKNTQGIKFSAWIKTANVVKGSDEWMGAVFSVEFLDKTDKKIGDGVNITRLAGDNDWELVKKAVKIPASAVSFKILLAMGYASGTMLVDDVTANAMNAEDVAKL